MKLITRFNRDNFLETVSCPLPEKDLLTNNVETRNMKYTIYRVTEFDIGRPDLLSRKLYGTQDYWWYLMKFNEVDDVWNDLYSGMLLKVPSIEDINLFITNNSDKYR